MQMKRAIGIENRGKGKNEAGGKLEKNKLGEGQVILYFQLKNLTRFVFQLFALQHFASLNLYLVTVTKFCENALFTNLKYVMG